MKTTVYTDGFEGWAKRGRARAQAMTEGRKLTPTRELTFADAEDLLDCLTSARVRLFRVAKTRAMSITGLAIELGRNRAAVTRDVKKLREYGLVELREQVNPGHGKVQIVHPVAQTIDMRVRI